MPFDSAWMPSLNIGDALGSGTRDRHCLILPAFDVFILAVNIVTVLLFTYWEGKLACLPEEHTGVTKSKPVLTAVSVNSSPALLVRLIIRGFRH